VAAHTVIVSEDAADDLSRLPRNLARLITTKFMALGTDPHPAGALPLKGALRGKWRIKALEHFRVLYTIDVPRRIVVIEAVVKREDVY
jgi:mRNA-degrading endonuclease RelE of RelBE toxin-antitoxin system